ncbi:MAG: hypothetical protein K2X38_16900 [Gemmataceae bacterium]|nr:hypothetical protein [Gemmataceae bacterium]
MRSPLDNMSADAIPFEEEQAMSLRNGFGFLALANIAFFLLMLAVSLGENMPGGSITSWVVGSIASTALFGLMLACFRSFAMAEEYTEAGDLRGSWVCLGIAGLSMVMVLTVGDTPATMRIWMLSALSGFFACFGFYIQRRASLTMASLTPRIWYLGALGAAAIPGVSAVLVAFGTQANVRETDGSATAMWEMAILAYAVAYPLVSAGFFGVVWKLLTAQVSLGLWHRRDEIFDATPRGTGTVADLYATLNLGRRPPAK